jgi:hypothetical protein
MQVPPTQLALGQATPQPLQLKGSLLRSAHKPPHMTVGKTQPISTWTEEQNPPSQMPIGQAAPQPPQLFGSLLRSTHPVPQSVRPAASQACRAGAAPARPGSQPATAPMARRRSTWRRDAPAATARATASKLALSTEFSSRTEHGRGTLSHPRLGGTPRPTPPHPHRVVSRPGPRYSRRGGVSSDAASSRSVRRLAHWDFMRKVSSAGDPCRRSPLW